MNATVERMRPAAVESHVRDVLRRAGADDFVVTRATQAAARSLRAGNSAWRSIQAGIDVGTEQLCMQRGLTPARAIDADHLKHTWGDVLTDCLGLLGLLALSGVVLLVLFAFLAKP